MKYVFMAVFMIFINLGYVSHTSNTEIREQEVGKSIHLIKIPGSELEQQFKETFNNLFKEVTEATECSNSQQSFICWLAEDEARKYNSSVWHDFQKTDMHTNMTSADIQREIISVLLYRGFNYETSIEIIDFKNAASLEDRARVELIRALTPVSFFQPSSYSSNSYMLSFYKPQ